MLDPTPIFAGARVMPILTVADASHAAPLAQALFAGGIRVCEVTLRTPAALAAITAMRAAAPDLIVGAGTIRTSADLEAAIGAGAQFIVTPGTTPRLAAALATAPVPSVPGMATGSEAMALAELGFTMQKLFPASAAGGQDLLKALYGPLPDLRFCPTGGISADTMASWLGLPNVACVGGSWIAPGDLQAKGSWAEIEARARDSVGRTAP